MSKAENLGNREEGKTRVTLRERGKHVSETNRRGKKLESDQPGKLKEQNQQLRR